MSRRDYTPPKGTLRDLGPQGSSAAGGRSTTGTPSWITIAVILVAPVIILVLGAYG